MYTIETFFGGTRSASLTFSVGAGGQYLALDPPFPNDTDVFAIRFTGEPKGSIPNAPAGCADGDMTWRKVSMENNVLRITRYPEEYPVIAPDPPPIPPFDLWKGRLPAGNYTAEVYCATQPFPRYAWISFTVATSYQNRGQRVRPASFPPQPMANYTGHWTPQDDSGWGMTIKQVASRQLAITLYTYGTDGGPLWYFCGGGAWDSTLRYRTDCSIYSGTPFGANSTAIQGRNAASIDLSFAPSISPLSIGYLGLSGSIETFLRAQITIDGRSITKQFVPVNN